METGANVIDALERLGLDVIVTNQKVPDWPGFSGWETLGSTGYHAH